MNLEIHNIGRISSAQIALDGITIIAGGNNSGKSTVGKALFAMFEAFGNAKDDVSEYKAQKCSLIVLRSLTFPEGELISRNGLADIVRQALATDSPLQSMKRELAAQWGETWSESEWEGCAEKLAQVLNLSDEDIRRQLVLNIFNEVFNRQISSFYAPEEDASCSMTIRGRTIKATFGRQLPRLVQELTLNNAAYFIDDPDILDTLARELRPFGLWQLHHRTLRSTILKSYRITGDGNPIDDLLLRERLSDIEQRLTEVMHGSLQFSEDEDMQFVDETFPGKPLKVSNLSKGLKGMAMLQALFGKGAIQEHDVLILDEPEIHLHPEWQIKYAEFLVRLQKAFKLTILLTSHSPDFIQAIRLFSRKHGLDGTLNAYLSVPQTDGNATMKRMPEDDFDEIYEKFASCVDTLMDLRSDLEDGQDE